ncbi:hypothetical protein [Spirosoma lituiforme]
MKLFKDWVANPFTLSLKDTLRNLPITIPVTFYCISSFVTNHNIRWILIIFVAFVSEILLMHLCVIIKSISSISNFYDLLKDKKFLLREIPRIEEYIISKKILEDINSFLPSKFRLSLIRFYNQFGIEYKPIKIYLYTPVPYKNEIKRSKIDFIVPTAYSIGYEPGSSIILLPYSEEDLRDPLTKFKLYHEIAHVLPINQRHDSAVWLHGISSTIVCFIVIVLFGKSIWIIVLISLILSKDLLHFQRGIFDLVNECRADHYSYSQLDDTELMVVSEDLILQWERDINTSTNSRDIIQKRNRLQSLQRYVTASVDMRSFTKPQYSRVWPYTTVLCMFILGFFNNTVPSNLTVLFFSIYLFVLGLMIDLINRAIKRSQFILQDIIAEKLY